MRLASLACCAWTQRDPARTAVCAHAHALLQWLSLHAFPSERPAGRQLAWSARRALLRKISGKPCCASPCSSSLPSRWTGLPLWWRARAVPLEPPPWLSPPVGGGGRVWGGEGGGIPGPTTDDCGAAQTWAANFYSVRCCVCILSPAPQQPAAPGPGWERGYPSCNVCLIDM